MEHSRKQKLLMIFALVFGIASLSVGFAAFSATLNISSSATVSPNGEDFSVVFSKAKNGIANDDNGSMYGQPHMSLNGATAVVERVGYKSVEGLNVNFTNPGQYANIDLYVHNNGQYDAYLRGVTYTVLDNGSYKKCSASTSDSTKATDSLVQAACEGIRVTISIGGTTYEVGSTNISGHKLEKGESEEVQFKIEYVSDAAMADGPFVVELCDFKFDYSTVDRSVDFISFKINGVTYQAEDGMTFADWIRSSYNTGNYSIDTEICNAGSAWYPIDVESIYIIGNDSYDADNCKAVD